MRLARQRLLDPEGVRLQQERVDLVLIRQGGCGPLQQRLARLILAQPLQSARKAATLRVRQGALSVVDGPFAETKEQIGGFFLFEASSFPEAIEVAAKWPSARIGSIEVRPVEEGLRTDRRYGE